MTGGDDVFSYHGPEKKIKISDTFFFFLSCIFYLIFLQHPLFTTDEKRDDQLNCKSIHQINLSGNRKETCRKPQDGNLTRNLLFFFLSKRKKKEI